MAEKFVEDCARIRKGLKAVALVVKNRFDEIHISGLPAGSSIADSGEICANLMLSYRHLEDAVMRLGKAIQAYDGGKSVYDK